MDRLVAVVDVTDCADCGQAFDYTYIEAMPGDKPIEPTLCPDCESHQE